MLKKSAFVTILLILLLSIPISGMASLKPIEIYINDEKIESDVPPVIVNDRTLAPVRVISENLGAEVYWDNDNRLVQIMTPSKTIILKIDDRKALVDGDEVLLDVPAKIVNNRTMVPLRFLGETLGAKVSWNNDLRRVIINRTGTKIVDFSYETIGGKPLICCVFMMYLMSEAYLPLKTLGLPNIICIATDLLLGLSGYLILALSLGIDLKSYKH
jgi:N-acetylmuramoyl-L-alanine amidase